MSFLKKVEKIISTPRSKVLDYLIDHRDEKHNTHRIWKARGKYISRPTISTIVREFHDERILIEVEHKGRGKMYKLNHAHDIVQALIRTEDRI